MRGQSLCAADFAALRRSGIDARRGALRLRARGNGQKSWRVAFAFPGLRPAVVRNRLRRRMKEILRQTLAPECGIDLLITGNVDAAGLSYTGLQGELEQLLSSLAPRLGCSQISQ